MVELKEPFATLWRGKDPFEEVKTLQKLAALCALKWRAKAIFSNGIAARP